MSTRAEIQALHNLGLDTFAFDLAKRLLTCLEDQLVLTLGGAVCRAAVYPGEEIVPMDWNCMGTGCHGQAATRVYRIYPVTARFAQQDFSPRVMNCASSLFGVTVEMTVYRCAAQMREDGTPPSVEHVEWNARVALDDAAAMRRAVQCCYSPVADERTDVPYAVSGEYVLDDWNPVGPAGDGHGGRMRVFLPVTIEGCDFVPNEVVRPDPAIA